MLLAQMMVSTLSFSRACVHSACFVWVFVCQGTAITSQALHNVSRLAPSNGSSVAVTGVTGWLTGRLLGAGYLQSVHGRAVCL